MDQRPLHKQQLPSNKEAVPGFPYEGHGSPDNFYVSDARVFLEKRRSLLRPLKLMRVARGLSELLHQKVDHDPHGHVKRLDSENTRSVR